MFSGFGAEPKSREELLDIIKGAVHNKVVDQEALHIIEGALDVANQQVREIMIPRSQMVVIKADVCPQQFLPTVIESGHSRFPVIGESSDDIKGILLAKDLLPLILQSQEDFNLSQILRVANIVPESKRLNVLLKEFREQRQHMALVIDEYGGISGLITIEDILEEIVGEIEDETDEDIEDFIRQVSENDYILKALTPIEDFNDYFRTNIGDDEFDTMGGIVMQAFGHMPGRNEKVSVHGFTFRVLYSDSRKIHLLRVSRKAKGNKKVTLDALPSG
ncbi:MAG: magnesium and cobalt transporter [Lentisphaeria bacterium]|jgi:magnesium and cobalt transporter